MSMRVILLAGGSGMRFDADVPKQMLPVEGGSIMDIPLRTYSEIPFIDAITIVASAAILDKVCVLAEKYDKVDCVVPGGATRQESVCYGLRGVSEEFVLIHDAARPLVHVPAVISCHAILVAGEDIVNTVLHVSEGMVVLDHDGLMVGSADREMMASGQCPQGFRTSVLRHAHEWANTHRVDFHDDCAMVLALPGPPHRCHVVQGHPSGFKLTFKNQLTLLNYYMEND